jgi:hypothetical protein
MQTIINANLATADFSVDDSDKTMSNPLKKMFYESDTKCRSISGLRNTVLRSISDASEPEVEALVQTYAN